MAMLANERDIIKDFMMRGTWNRRGIEDLIAKYANGRFDLEPDTDSKLDEIRTMVDRLFQAAKDALTI